MKQRNEVIFQGTIISLSVSSKLGIIRLALEGPKGRKDFPSVTFHDTSQLKNITLHQRVLVKGHTQNRLVTKPSGRRGSQTVFIGDSIEPVKRKLLNYFSDEIVSDEQGGFPADENSIVFAGKVVSVYTPSNTKGNVSILKVNCEHDGRLRQCDFSCFSRQAETASMLEKGDNVAIIGSATTDVKEKDGQKVYYQSVVCQDISKLSDDIFDNDNEANVS